MIYPHALARCMPAISTHAHRVPPPHLLPYPVPTALPVGPERGPASKRRCPLCPVAVSGESFSRARSPCRIVGGSSRTTVLRRSKQEAVALLIVLLLAAQALGEPRPYAREKDIVTGSAVRLARLATPSPASKTACPAHRHALSSPGSWAWHSSNTPFNLHPSHPRHM